RHDKSGARSVEGLVIMEGKDASGVGIVLSGYEVGQGWRHFAGATDAEGRFDIGGVAPGSYEIASHAYVFVLANQPSNARNTERIVIGAGETIKDVSIELVRGGVVTGRVIDEDGRPVVGSYVSLQSPPGDRVISARFGSESVSGMGETDDRGVYRLFGVPPGRYLVSVGLIRESHGISGNYWVFRPDTTDQSKAKVVELSAGQEKTE